MTAVFVTRLSRLFTSLVPIEGEWGTLLSQAVIAPARANATSHTVTLGWAHSGLDIVIAGTGLTLGADGRLLGGTIGHITVLDENGQKLAEMGSTDPGGLGLSVADLRAAYQSPALLDELLADWTYTYTAADMTDGAGYTMTFEGGRGADSLTGSATADLLRGAAGNDTIRGSGGDDDIRGDDSHYLYNNDPIGDDLIYGGGGDDNIAGDAGHDSLYGGKGADEIDGDIGEIAGNDTIWGGGGRDRIMGGFGDDALYGGGGHDTLLGYDFGALTTLWTVNLATGVSTGQGTDAVSGFESVGGSWNHRNDLTGSDGANGLRGGHLRDRLDGLGGDDRIFGWEGADRIFGRSGADMLGGGAGSDILWGGTGADAFVLRETGKGVDRVQDFASAKDDIWLGGAAMGELWGQGPLAAQHFKDLDAGAADADDHYLYDRSEGELWLDADGGGAGARVLLLRLDPGTQLAAGDLHLRWDVWSGSFAL